MEICIAVVMAESTANVGLPLPVSRLAIVDRGTSQSFDKRPCVSPRLSLKYLRLLDKLLDISSWGDVSFIPSNSILSV